MLIDIADTVDQIENVWLHQSHQSALIIYVDGIEFVVGMQSLKDILIAMKYFEIRRLRLTPNVS